MKVVAMLGGLGSQMFKYAFYLQICDGNQCYIDTTAFFLNNMWNGYELHRIFGISAPDLKDYWLPKEIDCLRQEQIDYKKAGIKAMQDITGDKIIISFLRGYCYTTSSVAMNLLCLAFNKIKRYFHGSNNVMDTYPPFYKTSKISFFFDEFNHTSDTYIGNGSMKECLKEVYKFPDFDDDTNIVVQRKMLQTESVAVHIRRSDHMYDNVKLFEEGYFQKAIQNIKEKIHSPTFYIFSDEPEWCRMHGEQLGFKKSDEMICVDWNSGENSYKDMQLMTYCKHNILSISSFGWWGYYLSDRNDKLVYAPKGYWLEVPTHY